MILTWLVHPLVLSQVNTSQAIFPLCTSNISFFVAQLFHFHLFVILAIPLTALRRADLNSIPFSAGAGNNAVLLSSPSPRISFLFYSPSSGHHHPSFFSLSSPQPLYPRSRTPEDNTVHLLTWIFMVFGPAPFLLKGCLAWGEWWPKTCFVDGY